jgi:hypothetical protein
MTPLAGKGVISLSEATDTFGVSRATLYEWERRGLLRLERFVVGRPRVFVRSADLSALVRGTSANGRRGRRSSVAARSERRGSRKRARPFDVATDPFFVLAAQPTGIRDLAAEHDRYAYGVAKRRRTRK